LALAEGRTSSLILSILLNDRFAEAVRYLVMLFLVKNEDGSSSWLFVFILSILALIPVAAYVLFVVYLHRDLPIFDDYVVQLELARLKAAPELSNKLTILFSQLNEHRLVYTRFWFWFVHLLHGTLSYSALIVIGNLPLLGIWLLLAWMLCRLHVPLVALIPLSWLLFQLQYHANSLWAMASLQSPFTPSTHSYLSYCSVAAP
jgi:hypothetical protein